MLKNLSTSCVTPNRVWGCTREYFEQVTQSKITCLEMSRFGSLNSKLYTNET